MDIGLMARLLSASKTTGVAFCAGVVVGAIAVTGTKQIQQINWEMVYMGLKGASAEKVPPTRSTQLIDGGQQPQPSQQNNPIAITPTGGILPPPLSAPDYRQATLLPHMNEMMPAPPAPLAKIARTDPDDAIKVELRGGTGKMRFDSAEKPLAKK